MAWLGGYLTGHWTEEVGEDGRWKVKIEALARSFCLSSLPQHFILYTDNNDFPLSLILTL